ncbi:MAG: HprK-related kinase B [Pseudomonadota bacterium]|nr:HprK-related kinase B [Pseudomonadota bacterium]
MKTESEQDTVDWTATLSAGYPLLEQRLHLQMGACRLCVQSNSAELLARLQHYFRHMVVSTHSVQSPLMAESTLMLTAIQRPTPGLNVSFTDWRRETGKSGRKDAYYDVPGGRLVHKVRTGMVFLQCAQAPLAVGDCLANDNQVINFINAQFMTWLQQRGWLICHAAAVEYQGRSIAIAAFSGGGKSTSMLRLLDQPGTRFLTNDRLFILREQDQGQQHGQQEPGVKVAGVPKLPRINPGTIVNNPVLQSILSPQRREQLQSLPAAELWELEEKYDVDVLELYGDDRIQHLAELDCFLLLNWQHNGTETVIQAVDLDQRRDLLPALMKAPGPFYQQSNGQFLSDQTPLDAQRYVDVLAGAAIYEVSGGVDFDALAHWCRQRLA